MILFYSLGGGLGHISRSLSVIKALKLQDHLIIAISPHIQIKNTEHITYLSPPQSFNHNALYLSYWLLQLIKQYKVNKIIVDCFPQGILGEFRYVQLEGIEKILISRYLNWPAYQTLLQQVNQHHIDNEAIWNYQQSYQVETLHPQQLAYLKSQSESLNHLSLKPYTVNTLDEQTLQRLKSIKSGNECWFIVHSGGKTIEGESEVKALIKKAQQDKQHKTHIKLILFNYRKELYAGIDYQFSQYPVNQYYFLADRIYTGCGFNSVLECQDYREIHHTLPFKRRFDDQFWRCQNMHLPS